MGVEYRIDTASALLLIRHWGWRDPAEASALVNAFTSDPDFSLGMDALVDTREMTGGDFSSNEVMSTALLASMLLAPVRRVSRQAMIVPVDGPGRDLMHRYAAFSNSSPNIETKLFETPEAALVWLERPDLRVTTLFSKAMDWSVVSGQGEDTLS